MKGGLVSMAELEKEPMLLLDTTGSMNYATSATDQTPRRDTIKEAISLLVEQLAAEDSQAADEEEEEGGGLRTITFAGGSAHDVGDLNPNNLTQKWDRIFWGGGTEIMPAWREMIKVYTDEFGSRPAEERPLLMALTITDGEASDTDKFARAIAQAAGGVYVVLAIIGYGGEHDRAMRQYEAVAQQNSHVKVLPFAGETDPSVIANALKAMIA
jgi:hypothetical protein